jgi:outer membrane protein assembly factor BamB
MRRFTSPGLKSAAWLLALAALASAGDARADWPAARHDAKRTGVANGTSDIAKPVVAWSAYLGGSITGTSLLVHDLDGDGQGEIIYCSGGVVAAKRADGSQVWSTRIFGRGALDGIEDLDGDGQLEVVTHTRLGAWVLDLATGAVRWSQPSGEMGAAAYLRLADMNADGRVDLMMTECGGCGGSKAQTGFIYSFAGGFTQPKRVELGPVQGATPALTVAVVDPNAPAAVLANQSSSVFALLDGATGKTLALSPSIGGQLAYTTACLPGDIDGSPGEELVCVASESPSPAPVTPDIRKVFALKYKVGAAPSLDLLWSYSVPVGEALCNVGNEPLVDLDGDGKYEVVVSGHHADGTYSTHVLAAATGAEITKVPGEGFLGTALLESPKVPTVLTFAAGNTTAWAYNGVTKKLIKRWTINDRYPLTEPYWSRSRRAGAALTRPLTVDLDGDGILDLVTGRFSPNPAGMAIQGYTTSTGSPSVTEVAALSFPKGSTPLAFWSVPAVDLGVPQIAVAKDDGTLRFLDQTLTPTSSVVRFGGHYAPGAWEDLGKAPVIASVDGAAQAIFANDSRGRVVRLDASKATPTTPVLEVWSREDSFAPIVVPGLLAGKAGVATLSLDDTQNPPLWSVNALDAASGSVVWSYPLGLTPTNDILAGDFDLDGIPDIAAQGILPGAAVLTTVGLSGKDGQLLWSFGAEKGDCGLQSSGFALADWDGDGRDDVLQVMPNVRADSGKDGSLIAKSTSHPCYFLPTPVDTDGDGKDELLLHGGSAAAGVLDHSLQSIVYESPENDNPYPYGAVAACPSGPVLVEGSLLFASRLKLTELSTGAVVTRVLAGGQSYLDEAAASAAMAGRGQLTSASIHRDLRGDGRPVAMVGSTDGFLYAVDPCTGDLVFAKDFGFDVGEIVFGDSDGDGLDEILVSVADGNLYALKNDPESGAGGAGGAGGTSATTGEGGAGGEQTTITTYPLQGRAGCYCAVPAGPAEGAPALFVLAGAFAAVVRRARRRS